MTVVPDDYLPDGMASEQDDFVMARIRATSDKQFPVVDSLFQIFDNMHANIIIRGSVSWWC